MLRSTGAATLPLFSLSLKVLRCICIIVPFTILYFAASIGAIPSSIHKITPGHTFDSYLRIGSGAANCAYRPDITFNPPIFPDFVQSCGDVLKDSVIDHVPILITPHLSYGRSRADKYVGGVAAWYKSVGYDAFTICSASGLVMDHGESQQIHAYWMAFTNFPYGITQTVSVINNSGCVNAGQGSIDNVNLLSLARNDEGSHHDFIFLRSHRANSALRICAFDTLTPRGRVALNHFTAVKSDNDVADLNKIEILHTNVPAVCTLIRFDKVKDIPPYVFVSPQYISESTINVVAWVEFVSEEAAEVCVAVDNAEKSETDLINFEKLYINYFAISPTAKEVSTGGSVKVNSLYGMLLYTEGKRMDTIEPEPRLDHEYMPILENWIKEIISSPEDVKLLGMYGLNPVRYYDWSCFIFVMHPVDAEALKPTLPLDIDATYHEELGQYLNDNHVGNKVSYSGTYDYFAERLRSVDKCSSDGVDVLNCNPEDEAGSVSLTTFCEPMSTGITTGCDQVEVMLCMSYACESSDSTVTLGINAQETSYFPVIISAINDEKVRFGTVEDANADFWTGASLSVDLSGVNDIFFYSKEYLLQNEIYDLLKPIILISPSHRNKASQNFSYTSGLMSFSQNFVLSGFTAIVMDGIHKDKPSPEVKDGVIVDWLLIFDTNPESFQFTKHDGGCLSSRSEYEDVAMLSLYHEEVAASDGHSDTVWLKWHRNLREVCWRDVDTAQDHTVDVQMLTFKNTDSYTYFKFGHLEFDWPRFSDAGAMCIGLSFDDEYTVAPAVFVTIELEGARVELAASAYIEYNTNSQALICVSKLHWSQYNGLVSDRFRIHYLIFDSFAYRLLSTPYYNVEVELRSVKEQTSFYNIERFLESSIGGAAGGDVSIISTRIEGGTVQVLFEYVEHSPGILNEWCENHLEKQAEAKEILYDYIEQLDEFSFTPICEKHCDATVNENPAACSFPSSGGGPGSQVLSLSYRPESCDTNQQMIICARGLDELDTTAVEYIINKSESGPSGHKLQAVIIEPIIDPVTAPEPDLDTDSGSSGLSGGAIAGIVVGILVGLLLIALIFHLYSQRKMKLTSVVRIRTVGTMPLPEKIGSTVGGSTREESSQEGTR